MRSMWNESEGARANKKGEESDSDGIFEFGANFLVMRGRRGGRG